MKKENKIKLFLVDDDAVFLKLLQIEFFAHADFDIETFATGELCIKNLSENSDVIILDYHLDEIKATHPDIPVIMLSSQDKIDVAINCMHHRALDYVVKSETAFLRLQKIITTLFHYKKMEKELSWYMERM